MENMNESINIDQLKVVDLGSAEEVKQFTQEVNSSSEPVVVRLRDKDRQMAVAVAVPSNHPSSMSYLKELKDYNDSGKTIYDQIEICRKLYIFEGVIGTVIDKLIEFSFSEFRIEGLKKGSKEYKLLKYWCDNVNKGNNNILTGIDALNKSCAYEYYVSGNTFIYSKWSNAFIQELKNKYKLPASQVTLNPMIIEIPPESVQFGNKIIQIAIGKLFGNKLLTPKEREKVSENLPLKLKNLIKTGKDIVLDPYYIFHMRRKGSMYSGWGIPYLTRAIMAIASKRRLRALDDSTIDGMINSITVFKIGDPDIPETWGQDRINAFKSLLASPAASNTLVAGWDVEVIHISPSGDILNFTDRYTSADQDVLYALGISLSIITGQGQKAGDAWASMLFMIETLEDYKTIFKSFVEDSFEKILAENGFENKKATVRFRRPRLNKDDIRNIVLALYDRGKLSIETLLDESGYDKDSEVERIKAEKEEGLDEIMMRPETPFSSKPGQTPKPNPQTNLPTKKNDPQKKETKIVQVDQKKKRVTPRMQGNYIDRIGSLMEYAFDNGSGNMEEDHFTNFIHNIYSLDEQGTESLIGASESFIIDVIGNAFTSRDFAQSAYTEENRKLFLEEINKQLS